MNDVALPAGATSDNEWELVEETRHYRIISGRDRHIPDVGFIGTSAVQFDDGTFDSSKNDGPRIWLGLGGDGISTSQAMQVACQILEAVYEVRGWIKGADS
jgi:hypothetical protein